MKIIFATSNKGKIREAGEILGPSFEIVTPARMGIFDDIEETGTTFRENSLIKARYIHGKTGLDCFADDSGLEVDALGGEPGVYSARYAFPGHDFDANIEKVLGKMEGVPAEKRTARFKTVVSIIIGGEEHCFEGCMEGHIAFRRSGNGGFGYDPIFIPLEYPDRSLAEVSEEMKNEISHRGKALRAMAEWLKITTFAAK